MHAPQQLAFYQPSSSSARFRDLLTVVTVTLCAVQAAVGGCLLVARTAAEAEELAKHCVCHWSAVVVGRLGDAGQTVVGALLGFGAIVAFVSAKCDSDSSFGPDSPNLLDLHQLCIILGLWSCSDHVLRETLVNSS